MEELKDILEENSIKTFLKRFPKTEWSEALTKAMKLGISSMTSVEAYSSTLKSPTRKFPANSSIITASTAISQNPYTHFAPKQKLTPKASKKKYPLKMTPKSKPGQFDFKFEPNERLRFSSTRTKKKKSFNSLKISSKEPNQLEAPYGRTFDVHRSKRNLVHKEKLANYKKQCKTESKNETLAYMTSSSSSSLN